jgi:hypothetical protein
MIYVDAGAAATLLPAACFLRSAMDRRLRCSRFSRLRSDRNAGISSVFPAARRSETFFFNRVSSDSADLFEVFFAMLSAPLVVMVDDDYEQIRPILNWTSQSRGEGVYCQPRRDQGMPLCHY